jgi:hypothetical protein
VINALPKGVQKLRKTAQRMCSSWSLMKTVLLAEFQFPSMVLRINGRLALNTLKDVYKSGIQTI